jgi:hypothetical protein
LLQTQYRVWVCGSAANVSCSAIRSPRQSPHRNALTSAVAATGNDTAAAAIAALVRTGTAFEIAIAHDMGAVTAIIAGVMTNFVTTNRAMKDRATNNAPGTIVRATETAIANATVAAPAVVKTVIEGRVTTAVSAAAVSVASARQGQRLQLR